MEEIIEVLNRIASALEENNRTTQVWIKQQEDWHREAVTRGEQQLERSLAFIAKQNDLQRKSLDPQAFTRSERMLPLDPPSFPCRLSNFDTPLEQEALDEL